MIRSKRVALFVLLLLLSGCGKGSTAYWLEQLHSPNAALRLKAVRILPERKADAAQVIPALIEALQDEDEDVRRGAAFGLGAFGEEATAAVPALQACLRDPHATVRKAAGTALSFIDPKLAPKTNTSRTRGK
jgi:HEAT repeat protein